MNSALDHLCSPQKKVWALKLFKPTGIHLTRIGARTFNVGRIDGLNRRGLTILRPRYECSGHGY